MPRQISPGLRATAASVALFASALVLFSGPLLAAPATAVPRPPVETLLVVADEWCPYTCSRSARQQGYLVDMVRAAFEPLGYRIDYRVMPWPRALKETQEGRAAIALGATPRNVRNLVMPELPVGRDESSFAVRADSAWRYRDLDDLSQVTLGVTADYPYFPEVDDWIAQNRNDPNLIDVATGEAPLETSLRKLEAGRIDVFIENRNVLLYTATQRPNEPKFRLEGRVPGDNIVIGFSPFNARHAALAGVFDTRMREMRKSGELAGILSRYGLEDWVEGTQP
jgi:polar amino acid transport system substrate-binding protein